MRIGQACINERGTVTGGASGDQTGGEIAVRSWYNFPWDTYIECTDRSLAARAAAAMEAYCADSSHGYDQADRWGPDFDCSSLVLQCYRDAGLPLAAAGYTGNMEAILLGTGLFRAYKDSGHTADTRCAMRGGVYLNTARHTCMALDDGPELSGRTGAAAASPARKTCSAVLPELEKGCAGAGVAALQTLLLLRGETLPLYGADGEFGEETDAAVRRFQADRGLETDGVAGENTWAALVS